MTSNKPFEIQSSLVLSTRSGRAYGRREYYVKLGPKIWKSDNVENNEETLTFNSTEEVNRKRPFDDGVSLEKVGRCVSVVDPNLEEESPDDYYPEKSYRVLLSKPNHNIVLVRSTNTKTYRCDGCSEKFCSKVELTTHTNVCRLNRKSTSAIGKQAKEIRPCIDLSGDGPIAEVVAASLRKPSASADKPQKPIEGFGLCPYCQGNLQETEPLHLGRFRIVRTECNRHCVFCTFWHKHPDGLLEHKQKEHTLRCELCKMTFSTQDQSVVHFHEKHRPFHECLPCGRFFVDARTFSGHSKSTMHLDAVATMQRTWDMVRQKFDLPTTDNDARNNRFKYAKKVPKVLKEGQYSGCGIISHDARFLTELMSLPHYEWMPPIEASTPNHSVLIDEKNEQTDESFTREEGAHRALDLLAHFSPNCRRMAHQMMQMPLFEEMEVDEKETDQLNLLPILDSSDVNDYLSQIDDFQQSQFSTVKEEGKIGNQTPVTVPPGTFSLDPFMLEQNLISGSPNLHDYQPSCLVNDYKYAML